VPTTMYEVLYLASLDTETRVVELVICVEYCVINNDGRCQRGEIRC
jgi:hypothetical protein